jgi:hydrogenase expression/formation protein HypD
LRIREAYRAWDAAGIEVSVEPSSEQRGCRCGDVLRGRLRPEDCALFGRACTPDNPLGACMVSSEGACAAVYQFAGSHVE